MASPYDVLGVPSDADDAAIRKRYLTLLREYPPEHSPEEFAKINAAYEAIQSVALRAHRMLFYLTPDITTEEIMLNLLREAPRPRLSMKQLLSSTTDDGTRK